MKTMLISVLLLGTLSAQDPPKTPSVSKHLKPVAFLVGSWEGTGKFDGMDFTYTVKYEWTLNKNFIKSTYKAKVGDMVVWSDTSMIGYDKEKKKLVMFSFAMDGSIGTGEMVPSKDPKKIVFTVSIDGDDPRFKDGRSVYTKVDNDNLTVKIQTKKDKEWVTFMDCKQKRKKVQKPEKPDRR